MNCAIDILFDKIVKNLESISKSSPMAAKAVQDLKKAINTNTIPYQVDTKTKEGIMDKDKDKGEVKLSQAFFNDIGKCSI